MLGMFRRAARTANPDAALLGRSAVAVRAGSASLVPAQCTALAFDAAGHLRRIGEGARINLAAGESALCFHPGPYRVEIAPFAAAPEMGLRISFVIDADPRVTQQRFDLFLLAEGLVDEVAQSLTVEALTTAIESALRRELAQGSLELPPCTSLAEWNAFRAGLNQLLYVRFGVTVDDCVPVDLGERIDYAALLRARVAEAGAGVASPACLSRESQAATGVADSVADSVANKVANNVPNDGQALRRLFLELPCVMCSFRLALLPPGQALFRQHQALLQRLDLANLQVATMPALALAAPGQPLPRCVVVQRTRSAHQAVAALDEAWACLARLGLAEGADLPRHLEQFDRIVANLELALAGRRATGQEGESPC